jgi:hypothetical protein
MGDIEQFVIDGNVSRFVDLLRSETDPRRQDSVKRLLIAEEDKFGRTGFCLQMLERHLTDGAEIIAKQKRLIAQLVDRGDDPYGAELALHRFESIQILFYDLLTTLRRRVEDRAF